MSQSLMRPLPAQIYDGDSYGGRFRPLTRKEIIEARIYELERALMREPSIEHRRELVREYLALTDPEREIDL